MQPSLNVITLGVADLAASRSFYSDGLGWTPAFEVEGEVVFYQVGAGLLLSLFGLNDLSDDAGSPATPGTPFSLGWLVRDPDEVAVVLERAQQAGATVLKQAQRASWGGQHGYFADPDGHRWEVAHNPGFIVNNDGSLTLTPTA